MSKDSALDARELAEDAQNLSVAYFCERYGHAFLVRSSIDGELQPPERLKGEDWFKPTAVVHGTVMAAPRSLSDMSSSPGGKFFVYPIKRRRERSDDEVLVGRAPACDICIPDGSISKFHAAFTPADDGTFRLTDKKSRNGTMIATERLEPGQSYSIGFGKTVQFGRVRLTYMLSEQLIDFLTIVVGLRMGTDQSYSSFGTTRFLPSSSRRRG